MLCSQFHSNTCFVTLLGLKSTTMKGMRAFTLLVVFIGAAGCGAWLGLVVATLAGMVAPRTTLSVDLLVSLVAVATLMVAAVFVRRTESRLTLLHLILVAVFAMLNAVGGVYLVGPSWTICPGEPEMVASIAVSQGLPDFEACRAGGPLAGYPVVLVAAVVMSPSLLLALLIARSAIRRVQ